MEKILIATDTFEQVNGVSTTYKNILKVSDYNIEIIHPALFNYTSFRSYPEIQFCTQPFKVYKKIKGIKPSHIHIATEGPIGLVARMYCKFHKISFTSAYHTKFPEYLNIYFKFPIKVGYLLMRLFHKKSNAVLVPTQSCINDLKKFGFKNLALWTRGVDKDLIKKRTNKKNNHKIKVLSVGRISKEKNVEVLCKLNDDFDITIVGDGPELKNLKTKYPNINFPGYKFGKELAELYSKNDVFCFTSKTDTFGIVIIEALCNGLPVAAYNVTGPKDLIKNRVNGFLGDNLKENIIKCNELHKVEIQTNSTKKWSWKNCENILIKHLLKTNP
jgi:glycosyltransferase involved in cell wall biosynthesis